MAAKPPTIYAVAVQERDVAVPQAWIEYVQASSPRDAVSKVTHATLQPLTVLATRRVGNPPVAD